jgi:hypothetical protein
MSAIRHFSSCEHGYNNVPQEDATCLGKYGRPAVNGVKLEINTEQAAV